MEEVILRAAQLARRIAELQVAARHYSWRGAMRKESLRLLEPLEIEYAMLRDLIKILVVRS